MVNALEVENSKLKKLLADTDVGQSYFAGFFVKKLVEPKAKKVALTHVQKRQGLSRRRAFTAV